ncbi:hypothetical protein F5890DRAFT_1402401 [Lentinula detonsa]|uniref:F-box domain-containing protein n=1 Tax=Lentinula detonsa TaxID=2804962 RepID=A0AA38UVU0_9AGAR|nr:hypothetical protein F5890DRAFT_1402401 [Lentinula detonsa]
MINFIDLPLDLLPVILHHLALPQHFHKICLVNKIFNRFATPKLYERISVYSWHKHGKEKVILLFLSLSRYPHVAQHVRRLELRDFPKYLGSSDGTDTLEMVVDGLKNCTNLHSCTWTRDGSLNSKILEALQCSQSLQTLEINGRDAGNYDPQLLLHFIGLRKISLIMPSSSVISVLRPWLQKTGTSLTSLTIICKTSPIITDAKLELVAPYLSRLKHFHLTGCSKVTHEGIESILSANSDGIVSLGLEGLSPNFDLSQFRLYCARTNAFRRLRSITLTVNHQTPLNNWMNEIAALLPASVPLETFQVYSSGKFMEDPATERLWSDIVIAHQDHLTRFSIHRILISLNIIEDICRRCTKLEQLFIVIEQGSLGKLGTCLALAQNLRVIHVNYPLKASQGENAIPVLSALDAQEIIERCNSNIMQFGCNTRVWQVNREILLDRHGAPIGIERRVMRYEGLDIPEPFLVVRT